MYESKQKKIAMLNDLSGYGRCSLTVAIPIISARKVQCCPIPTSILSNHTGFPNYFFDDYTDKMMQYAGEWKKLGLTFDGIVAGFLGSKQQIQIALDIADMLKTDGTQLIVDPIMGDHGKVYKTFTPELCQEMKKLVCHGDIITPNLTEACILTDTPYHEGGWKRSELRELTEKLHDLGPKSVIITGIEEGVFLLNVVSEGKTVPCQFQKTKKIGRSRPGTGDVFSSIIAANAMHGIPLAKSAKQAALFVKACIEKSEEMEIPVEDGVCFEELLGKLSD